MAHHLIFEGAELSGKSWVIAQIYSELEPKYAASSNVLDGCYWLNCDLGFFGTDLAAPMIENYLEIFRTLREKNMLIEKFSLSAAVYNIIYGTGAIDRQIVDQALAMLGFKIVLLTFPEDRQLIQRRLDDRLRLYPNYGRIAKRPDFYIKQQRLYQKLIAQSPLPYLMVQAEKFPDDGVVEQIRTWIGC
ncbi:MAG: hypothetical protein WC453_00265 [Patescibacteria group bacterium]